MLVIFILFVLQLFQQLSGSAIPYKYSDARKQAVIDKLAITLLLHQDKAIVYNEGTYSLAYSLIHSLSPYSLTVDVNVTKKVNEEIKDAIKFDTYRITNNSNYMKQKTSELNHRDKLEEKAASPMHSI